jgi:hypothetical protein
MSFQVLIMHLQIQDHCIGVEYSYSSHQENTT